MSQQLAKIVDIINNAQVLSSEEMAVLEQRLIQRTCFVPQYHQIEFDMFPNKLLLEKFIKYISYQDRLDLDKQSGYPADYSLEDRFKARTLKEEIIDHLKSISS